MFHDVVELQLASGKGGDGAVSFRREKFIPRGGPDGGDGGKGGDVYLEADRQLSDLNHLASVREIKAENGTGGSGRKMIGANGEDLIVRVPVGTQIFRLIHDTWKLVADLNAPGKRKKVLFGGQGGLGNVHYATATHRTPRHAQPGEPAETARFKFELQLIADIGIIGEPNAGKSTFLSIVTEAKPKIGNYPFTTLSPVLGVANIHDSRIVLADIPGLIEGASEGKGLGHTFLRHVKRTKLLLHFIDSLEPDYAVAYQRIRSELAKFDQELASKPEIVVITKGELLSPDQKKSFTDNVSRLKEVLHPVSTLFPSITISSVTGLHTEHLLVLIASLLTQTVKTSSKPTS